MNFDGDELKILEKRLGRTPTQTEMNIVAAQWSEHCSYKSSKKHLKTLPMDGPHIITGAGYDSGIIDVGDGYVVTVHIESHNHPSAVEPFGGAATGVGGVIRDILSTGTRPIGILNSLRFGDPLKDDNAKFRFKNSVSGIAHYGNCIGIPTVGGEIGFDECFNDYALVDVAAVGFGEKKKLFVNHADVGDVVALVGGSTGRDGIGGSQFASDDLNVQDRSAVQIPDPFVEKLVIETILEARDENCIKAIKDLGGGGLACAISETAHAMSVGISMDVDAIHKREIMTPDELMISESQERMLVITDNIGLEKLQSICTKYNVLISVIGSVTSGKNVSVLHSGKSIADMDAEIISSAPLLDRPAQRPKYLDDISCIMPKPAKSFTDLIYELLSNPNIASKSWVYRQYDHEVGIRTIIKPGMDAVALRLDNSKYLSLKMDANPSQCYLDPYNGTIGCFEEACRNVICTGATPIGMVDHLQFANPNDPEIFWTFLESLRGLVDFAKYLDIPCVGGKVSFYNETPAGPIKPTPLIGVLGLGNDPPHTHKSTCIDDSLIIIGDTLDELGGSAYLEYIYKFTGCKCPVVNFEASKKNMSAILNVIKSRLAKSVHDCSLGGLAIAICELSINDNLGCKVKLDHIPSDLLDTDVLLFSESHSRYLLVVSKECLDDTKKILDADRISYGIIGTFGGNTIDFYHNDSSFQIHVAKAHKLWSESLRMMLNG